MFSFLKPKLAPEGPVEFDAAVEVDAPAAEVYGLIDWEDARNAKVALGNRVERLGREPDRFRLVMAEMPEHRFDMEVLKAVPDQVYAFSTDIQPRVGRLEHDEEHYAVESIGEGRCRLSLRTVATFRSGLTMKEFEHELIMVTMACQRALLKLKVHAEHGVHGVRALEQVLDG